MILATVGLVGCRILSAWHSVGGMVAGALVVGALLTVLVGRSQRARRWAPFTARLVAVLANAAALGIGAFVMLLAITGLLADGRLGTRVDWGWEFACVPVAAAVSLAVLAWPRSRRTRWTHDAAIGLNGALTVYGFWYWWVHERGTYLPSPPPLGTMLLLGLAAVTVMALVWDSASLAGASGAPASCAAGNLRRRLRPALVAATTAAVCLLLWISFQPVYQHRRRVAVLDSMGCQVEYHPMQNAVMSNVMYPFVPDSLCPPYFCPVQQVFVPRGARLQAADGRQLGELLKELPQLEGLHVWEIPPGAGRTLQPYDVDSKIVHLTLHGDGVTDETLADIAGFKWLESADFRNSRITDSGLKHLAGLPRLQGIRLDGAAVTGEGLVQLKSLGLLTMLDLSNTQIDDADLGHLHQLKSLQQLNLQLTRVTADGVRKLEKALPRCRVAWDGLAEE
ncbi:MAG: hypothetical protein WD847_21540 [Pirellulales bacterium]